MTFIKENFADPIIGAEVGVFRGDNALDILTNIPNVSLLYLIDPYQKYEGWQNAWADQVETAKNVAKKKLSPFADRIVWVYKKFEECSRNDVPHPLDFIYIDGNHSYEYVKKDIALAARLVKKNGVVGGHDYGWETVKKAVHEYCDRKEHNASLRVGSSDYGWDWWFIHR